jgi:drug/metabolite transporter (DMT)-like permease
MKTSLRKSLALAELMAADLFWGFGFVAVIWALRCAGPLSITAWRFLVAFLLTALISPLSSKWRREWTLVNLKLAFIPGVLISLTLIFQTWGLRYTTATRSGFITGLYVVFVPFVERFWYGRKLHSAHFGFVAIALLGTALIVQVQDGAWNWGDILTVIASLFATLQITLMSQVSQKVRSPVVFNSLQCLWAGSLALILALIFEPAPTWPQSTEPWWGLWSLALGSTWLAFALQVRAQKVISASLASLMYLLESPLALFFGYLCLAEQVNRMQAVGAVLILVASYLAIHFETRRLALNGMQGIVAATNER